MKALAFHIYEIVNVLLKPEIVHQSFSHTMAGWTDNFKEQCVRLLTVLPRLTLTQTVMCK